MICHRPQRLQGIAPPGAEAMVARMRRNGPGRSLKDNHLQREIGYIGWHKPEDRTEDLPHDTSSCDNRCCRTKCTVQSKLHPAKKTT